MSYKKIESCLIENCCEANFLKILNFRLEKMLIFKNFKCKLLWIMSYKKTESCLIENCCEASFFFEILNFRLEKC
jgi:hypothetical protein